MKSEKNEKQVLERILTIKQMIQEGRGGPLELHELGICYYLIENFRSASKFLAELAGKYPDYVEIASVQSLRCYCLVQEGELLEAELLLKERIPRDPSNTTLLGLLAHIQEKTHRIQEAIATHKRIIGIDPGNINSRNSIECLLAEHGTPADYPEAMEHLRIAVSNKPEHPAYLDSLGILLARQGDRDRARRAFVKALSRSPANTVILDHLKDMIG